MCVCVCVCVAVTTRLNAYIYIASRDGKGMACKACSAPCDICIVVASSDVRRPTIMATIGCDA